MILRISIFTTILITYLSASFGFSSATVYVAEPYMVQQPSYAGMQFYVYAPNGLEKNWRLTLDGYAVTQAQGKIWVYGTMQTGRLAKTNYVVGSVNPAHVGIIPYSGAGSSYVAGETEKALVAQPYDAAPGQTAKQAYIPDWSVNPAFLSASNWKSTIDRIGILRKYNIPVAWKGDDPTVIYAWTGKNWSQIYTRGEGIAGAISMNLYKLLKAREKGRLYRWYAEDVPILTEKTIGWGYLWMGEIFIRN
ncbi:MAG: hypothetical protein FWF87_01580 [Synergistaceae bacterium]|nr:hypothetical protein [Synergistaceae bacterium]